MLQPVLDACQLPSQVDSQLASLTKAAGSSRVARYAWFGCAQVPTQMVQHAAAPWPSIKLEHTHAHDPCFAEPGWQLRMLTGSRSCRSSAPVLPGSAISSCGS